MTTLIDDSTLQAGPPNVPSYRQLRMVSDWASAVRGRELHLEYNEDTGWMKHAVPSAHPPVMPMALLTPPNAVRPVLTRVEFEVRVPGTGAPVSTTLNGDRYSALLWGESAVEKFLFAYYASAAADGAARFLGRLFDAWYGYPDRVVQVCALAFRYGVDAEAGELVLDATVELVCLERNRGGLSLNTMSLGDFERKYPTGAPRGGPVAGTPGIATECDGWKVVGGLVSSIVAREAAEFVSGVRGRYVWFTLDDGRLTPWICPSEVPGPEPAGTPFASGVTIPVRSDRPAPSRVTLRVGRTGHPVVPRVPGATTASDATTVPDSVFWSDGAVEKLVLPYYASVKGRSAPFFTCLLMGKWDGLIPPDCEDVRCAVTALEHLLPRTGATVAAGDSTVYAVTHMPRSEYISEFEMQAGSSPALESRTRLLTLDETGFGDHALFGGAPSRPGS